MREDSADADLYKLLFRDLSTGSVIRQHREKDYHGNFLPKMPAKKGSGPQPLKSAFDDEELYELAELGQQFLHYAMTDRPPKIAYQYAPEGEQRSQTTKTKSVMNPIKAPGSLHAVLLP